MRNQRLNKEEVSNLLRDYCARYESQKKAAEALGISAGTVSYILNGRWAEVADNMWRNVASQVGYKTDGWQPADTANGKELKAMYADAQEHSLVLAITGDAGGSKTFTAKEYERDNQQVYMLCCNEFWNRKLFLSELLKAMGRVYYGYTVGEMMSEVVTRLRSQSAPLLILDEADKLSDQVLFFFITIYNQLEDECGIVLQATNHLEKRLRRGIKLNKKGYNEIWSRMGRKCIPLHGVCAADIADICRANGLHNAKIVDAIIDKSDSDLRRVKRLVHAQKGRMSNESK